MENKEAEAEDAETITKKIADLRTSIQGCVSGVTLIENSDVFLLRKSGSVGHRLCQRPCSNNVCRHCRGESEKECF